MPRSSKFTSSGLQRLDGSIQRNPPPKVSRVSFPQIGKFEGDCLFSNPIYMRMSAEDQALIQQNAQKAFFAWMMSNRVVRKSTTPMQKRKMYDEIVQKLLISSEIQSVARPAFGGEGSFELPVVIVDDPLGSCLSPFDDFLVTGVITSSHGVITSSHQVPEPMPTYCLPYTQPLSQPMSADCSRHSDGKKVMFPFLQFPGVSETLQQISKIQAQISRVVNEDTVDMSLGPIDFLPSP
jgi:hypothetical protein